MLSDEKMLTKNLIELGFSRNEAKIYLTLRELGPSTTGPIIKKSGLYRVIVYDTLEKLVKQGIVKYIIKNNRKNFEAEEPNQILEIIRDKEILAKKVVEELKKVKPLQTAEQSAVIYEGWKGIKAAQENYFKIMKKEENKEYLMVGASRLLHKRLDVYFNYFHERRAKLKIPAKLLFNDNNRKFGQLKEQFKPVQVRFMPKNIITPSWISMYGDMVLIGVAEEAPMAFFIHNKAVAESYRQYFYFMWEKSKR